jgi:NADH-quinone oxidoreductase subunit L
MQQAGALYRLLVNKYYFDWFNEHVIAKGSRWLGGALWRVGDQTLIDGALVNGGARTVGVLAVIARELQSGYLYHYAFAMIIALAALVGWLVFK